MAFRNWQLKGQRHCS